MGRSARKLATFTDLLPFEERGVAVEIVGGEIVEKALPAGEHGDAQLGIGGLLRTRYHGRGDDQRPGWWLFTETDIQFELHEVLRPDIAGWRRERHPDRPTGTPVLAVPDWVCEVLSPSTASRDLGPKRDVYHRHGVGHYWVVDVEKKLLLVYRWTEPGYTLVATGTSGQRLAFEPFELAEVDVGTLFGDEPLPT